MSKIDVMKVLNDLGELPNSMQLSQYFNVSHQQVKRWIKEERSYLPRNIANDRYEEYRGVKENGKKFLVYFMDASTWMVTAFLVNSRKGVQFRQASLELMRGMGGDEALTSIFNNFMNPPPPYENNVLSFTKEDSKT